MEHLLTSPVGETDSFAVTENGMAFSYAVITPLRRLFLLPSVSVASDYFLEFVSIAVDIINSCANYKQEVFVRHKLHKMSGINPGRLPYEIISVILRPYIITSNIDVKDGLANGAVGTLEPLVQNKQNEITRVRLFFYDKKTGTVA